MENRSVLNEQRVCLFVHSLGGGVGRMRVNLAREFVKRGLRVDVVLAKAEPSYLAALPEEARVITLRTSRVWAHLPELMLYLRRERPQAMLAAVNHSTLIALWARALAQVPARTVVSFHEAISTAIAVSRKRSLRLLPTLLRLFLPWADAIVAVSDGVAEDLARLTRVPRNQIRVIYNPVNRPEILSLADEPLEHPWFKPGQPPVVVSVGRLTQQKDYPTLIKAFSVVRKRKTARLMILGEGPERPKIEALVGQLGLNDSVQLPGFVSNPYMFVARSATFVLSSRWEGFGNVLVEALALGTPVVSTDCPSGPAEILEGGRWGILVPVGDIHSLAEALLSSLDGIKCRGQERAKRFDAETIAQEYVELMGLNTQQVT